MFVPIDYSSIVHVIFVSLFVLLFFSIQFLIFGVDIFLDFWSSMSQDRLNGLATLSIEKEMLKNIDVDVIINDFASQKARKNNF